MVTFDQVTARADRIAIVASGPSAAGMSLPLLQSARAKGVYVLAVNRAWDWIGSIDGWFTLDLNRKFTKYVQHSIPPVSRYVAVPEDYGQPDAVVPYHRNMPIRKFVTYLQRIPGKGVLGSCPGLATDPHQIHTGNSAYGALGAAFHMKPERIGLIGVDADRSTGYAYIPGRPLTTLYHLPQLFETALPQLMEADIDVHNGSVGSNVDCFPRVLPDDCIAWLMEDL